MPETPERDIRDPRLGGAGFYGSAPVPVWVTPDELLIVGVRNFKSGLTLQFSGRIWHTDGTVGELNQTIVPAAARALQFFSFQLYYGYLVHAAVTAAAGAGTRGNTLVSLQIARPPASAFATKWFLGQDYVTGMSAVYWPFGRMIPGIEGPGFLYRPGGAVPAAGTDLTLPVPTGARWRIRGGTATLTTSAVVATRQVALVIDDGATTFFTIESPSTQLAGVTQIYDLIPGDTLTTLIGTHQPIYIPPDLVLPAASRIRTVTGALQAADQWTVLQVELEEWLED